MVNAKCQTLRTIVFFLVYTKITFSHQGVVFTSFDPLSTSIKDLFAGCDGADAFDHILCITFGMLYVCVREQYLYKSNGSNILEENTEKARTLRYGCKVFTSLWKRQ